MPSLFEFEHSTFHAPTGAEGIILPEQFPITPGELINSNLKAQLMVAEWNENRRLGKQIAKWVCADARVDIQDPTRSVLVRSISAAASREQVDAFLDMVRSDSVEFVVVKSHHDQNTVIPGQEPNGCGGLQAKKDHGAEGNIARYVDGEIGHYDPVIQACLTAEFLAEAGVTKPILAASQDHLTGRVYPFVMYTVENGIAIRKSKAELSNLHNYDPKMVYANGLPTLPREQLPRVAQEFMERNDARVLELERLYPDLARRQKVQNPTIVYVSSHNRPGQTLYTLFREPGSFFHIGVARRKEGSQLMLRRLKNVLAQLEYPITHAVKNHDLPSGSFRDVNTILIDTENMEASEYLAGRIRSMELVQSWLALPDHQILVAETKRGRSQEIRVF